MKKSILLAVLVCLLSLTAAAGDIPESVLADDTIDVIIGTVTEVSGGSARVLVAKSLFNIVADDSILVQDFAYLVGSGIAGTIEQEEPSVGDFCAVAVMPDGGDFTVYGGLCARADSLDVTTLKLEGGNEFIKRMNEYINTGHYSAEHRMKPPEDGSFGEQDPAQTEGIMPVEIPVEAPIAPVAEPMENTGNTWLFVGAGVLLLAVCFMLFRRKK